MQFIDRVNLCGKILIAGGLSYFGILYLQTLQIDLEKVCIIFNNSATIGGFLSGSLHALTGPDHMAILLPLIFNKHWYSSCIYGIVWGCGHGVTSTVIGVISYVMKSYVVDLNGFFNHYRHVMNAVVGLTLIVIGAMGMYETSNSDDSKKDDPVEDDCNYRANKCDNDIEKQKEFVCRNEDSYFLSNVAEEGVGITNPLESPDSQRKNALSLSDPNALEKHLELSNIRNIFLGNEIDSPLRSVLSGSSSARVLTSSTVSTPILSKPAFQEPTVSYQQQQQQRSSPSLVAFAAIFVNGCVLGLSWDGLPSLAPSIVLNHHKPLILFLLAYLVGTASMMGIAAGAVGEATCFISNITSGKGRKTNRRLSFSSANSLSAAGSSGNSSTHSMNSGGGGGANSEPDADGSSNNNISERLAYMSSLTSCLIGAFWVVLAGVKYFTAASDVGSAAAAAGGGGGLIIHSLRAEIDNNDFYVLQLHNHDGHSHHHSHSELLLSGGSISIIVGVIFYTIYKEYKLYHYYQLRAGRSSGSLNEEVLGAEDEEDKGYSIIHGRETGKADLTLCHVLCQWGCNCAYPLIKLFRSIFDKQKR